MFNLLRDREQRLLSGWSLVFAWLARVNPKTRTPDSAIAVCFVLVLILAHPGTLGQLAGATSTLILVIFALMNLSLILIRRRGETNNGFQAPSVTPFVALVCCIALLFFVPWKALTTALTVSGVGVVFAFLQKGTPSQGTAEPE